MPISAKLTIKALELKETLYPSLRELTLADTLMPDDYNAPYQVIKQLLEVENQSIEIPDRHIKMDDDVDAQHVSDLRELCYQLWLYIYQNLQDPYIYDPDFIALKDVIDTMRIPKHGDELKIDEWNSISEFCRKMIDLLCKYSIISIKIERIGRHYRGLNEKAWVHPSIKDGFIYVGVYGSNAGIAKIDLSEFKEVALLELKETEEEEGAWVSSTKIVGNYLYASYTSGICSKIVKIDLSTFTIVDKLSLPREEVYSPFSLEEYGGYLYASGWWSATFPQIFRIFKIDLSTFSLVGYIDAPKDDNGTIDDWYDMLAIELNGIPYLFAGTWRYIFKIDLSTFSFVDYIAGDDIGVYYFANLAFDGTYLYVGCDHSRARIIKIEPINMTLEDILLLDEEDHYSMDMIIVGNYIYHGCDTIPARVVKIDLSTFSRVGHLTFDTDENCIIGLLYDDEYLHAITLNYTVVGKIDLSSFTIVDKLRLYPPFFFDDYTRISYDNNNIYVPLPAGTSQIIRINHEDFELKRVIQISKDFNTPLIVKVVGNYLFVTHYNVLIRLNRNTYQYIDSIAPSSNTIVAIAYYDGYLYVLTTNKLFKIDPNNMQVLDSSESIYSYGGARAIATYGNYILVGYLNYYRYGIIAVFDKNNLKNVIKTIGLEYDDDIWDMVVYEDYLFIALHRSPAVILRLYIKNIDELPPPKRLMLENGEEYATRGVIIHPVLIVGLATSPAKIIQVNMYSFTRVDSFTFEQDENEIADLCAIGNDLYAVTIDGKIVKFKTG